MRIAGTWVCRYFDPQEFESKYPDLKFDFIVAQSIIEHAVDLNGFMAWVAGRAKHGAILYVNGLTPDVITVERKANSFVKAHFVEHINYFPARTLGTFMRGHGFVPVQKEVVMVNARAVAVPKFVFKAAKKAIRRGPVKTFSAYYRYVGGTP